jgi:hypothetical protein
VRDGSQRRKKEMFIAWERHFATILGIVSFPTLTINSDASRTMRCASVRSALLRQLGSFASARSSSIVSYRLGSGRTPVSWLSETQVR